MPPRGEIHDRPFCVPFLGYNSLWILYGIELRSDEAVGPFAEGVDMKARTDSPSKRFGNSLLFR